MTPKQQVFSGEGTNNSDFDAHELDERKPAGAKKYKSPETKIAEDNKGDRHE